MRVADLIEELLRYPMDYIVGIHGCDCVGVAGDVKEQVYRGVKYVEITRLHYAISGGEPSPQECIEDEGLAR